MAVRSAVRRELERKAMYFGNIEATCLNDEDSPWIPFGPVGDKVAVKYFNIDPVKGEVILIARNQPGIVQPKHHHTGQVIVYTISGSWKYMEHDWIARPGSVVYEVANSDHTPVIMDEGTVALNIVQGELHFFDGNNNIVAVETWKTHLERYLKHCADNGIKPRDLTSFAVPGK